MCSNKAEIIEVIEAVDASYRKLAALPLHTLNRAELQALLNRIDAVEAELERLDRRVLGWLVSAGRPEHFGATTWADVVARRLRISPAEAQRRIALAIYPQPEKTVDG